MILEATRHASDHGKYSGKITLLSSHTQKMDRRPMKVALGKKKNLGEKWNGWRCGWGRETRKMETVAGDGSLKMDRTFVTRHKNGTSLQFRVEMIQEIGQLRGAS